MQRVLLHQHALKFQRLEEADQIACGGRSGGLGHQGLENDSQLDTAATSPNQALAGQTSHRPWSLVVSTFKVNSMLD
jgi:hypothetical protein